MHEVWNGMGILEGEGPSILTHSLSLQLEKKYFLARKVVARSVLRGGPGLPVFPQIVIQWMLGPSPGTDIRSASHYITDHVAKDIIQKVHSGTHF